MWKEILDFISPQLKWLKTKKKEQTNKINDANGEYGCREGRILIRVGGSTNWYIHKEIIVEVPQNDRNRSTMRFRYNILLGM